MNLLTAVLSSPMNLFWWLRIPLSWWMKINLVSVNVKEDIGFDPEVPVLYVLPYRSFSDLLVLYQFCKKLGLPLPRMTPRSLRRKGQASYLYLSKLGLLQAKRSKESPTPLQQLCAKLERDVHQKIQIIPVSIIWGRNPGNEERTLFELLFPDDEHAGILQKLFIILAQGRNTVVHFGKVISLREQVDQGPDAEQVSRKLRRVLRVHFRNQRNITLGPKSYDRNRVMRFVFDSFSVQDAIDLEVKKSGAHREKVEEKVRYYLREISAAQSASIIRSFDIVLSYIWNKIYEGIQVKNGDRLRDALHDNEIVYVPCHRSHLDYLILPYELYNRGLAVPHTVAGVNLSFWPLGPILRRGGGFFVRRSFRGNRLYSVVFSEYVNYLMTKGHPLAFFPEGGRSRTGRLLPPKTGLLAMVVQSYLRHPSKQVAFMPVSICYDKVAEVKAYLAELKGAAKKNESIKDLLNAWKVLTIKHGKAYIGFAEPIYLNQYLDGAYPSWRELSHEEFEGKPKWLSKMVNDLALDIMRGVNGATLVSPISIVSLALLSNQQRAISMGELLPLIDTLKGLLAKTQGADFVPQMQSRDMIPYCERISPINRYASPDGDDVVYLNEIDATLLNYYMNNIIHLFALPGLLAAYLQYQDDVLEEDVLAATEYFYPLLAADLFIQPLQNTLRVRMKEVVSSFIELGLVTRDGDKIARMPITSSEFNILKSLGRMLSPLLDRYALGISLLAVSAQSKMIDRDLFEKDLYVTAQKLALLKGVTDPEVTNKGGFKTFCDGLKNLGLLGEAELGAYAAHREIELARIHADRLLDPNLLRNVMRQYS